MTIRILMQGKNRYLLNKTVHHEWKALDLDLDKRFKPVILQKSEFQHQGSSILIGIFRIILMSISQKDMQQQFFPKKCIFGT